MAMEQSLFGPSASAVQDQLLQQDAAFGNNLTPVGLATTIGGSAGRHLGNLMGMEDPRVAEAKAVQEAVQELRNSGVDMNDPAEYFKRMAGIFGAKGLTKQAEMAAAKALEYQTKKEERADRADQRKYKLDEHTLAMEKHYIDNATARVKLQKELEKAAGKPDFEKLQAFIKDTGKDASVESIVAAVQEFNKPTGTLESAISKLEGKEKKDVLAKTLEANGRVYVYNPEAAKANPNSTHPTMKDYVDAGAASDRSTKITVPVQAFDKLQTVRERYIAETRPYSEIIRNTNFAIKQLDNAVNNPASLGPARHAFASVFKVDSNMGKKEIDQLVESGDLPGRLAQGVWGFLSGELTQKNADAMKEAIRIRQQIAGAKKAKVQQTYRSRKDLTADDLNFVTSDAEEMDPSVAPAQPNVTGVPSPERLKQLLEKHGGKK